MKKWYDSTNSAQRIFLFVVAVLTLMVGVVTFVNSYYEIGLALVLPLLLMIYLQLGAKRKTEANDQL